MQHKDNQGLTPPRASDPGWAHGIMGKEEGDDGDVVRLQDIVSTRGTRRKRGKEVVERIFNRSKRQKKQHFSTVAPIAAQPIHQSFASQESMDEADMAVARFLYDAGIQFTAANSQYFQEMADAIAAVGPEVLAKAKQGHLHQMFTGATWMQSTLSKQRAGLEVAEIIVEPLFWSMCEQASKEEFHSPLHAAAYYLNPSIYYNPNFSSNKVIQKGLLDCIETLEPDLTAQVMITSNINFYEEAVGDFGRPMALRGRDSLAPATWWSLYASDYPDLQRNRLEHQRLNDLIFVHFNLHLQERQTEARKARIRRGMLDPICMEAMDANMGDWVEDPGVLEGEDLSWMDVTVPSEPTFLSHKVRDLDDCNDSTDDRGSDDSRGATEVIFRGNLNLPKPLCKSSFIVALEETFDFFLQKSLPPFFSSLKIGEESGTSIPYFMNSGFSLASPAILRELSFCTGFSVFTE
ncbi:hypothetical protein CMV_021581 [Castanea mollissima]|uniref:Uncharacterized protein n=1 Tax=Castanea mollissima TaxID=60419 RepID=A0A8J4V919_9ROSI|nr:hypothetical protein CMV_021581 [Castanea mollissima]